MFLESLELHGFKSFAHRTKLTFSRGVTAIVGPNGCGKSNVLDAIRWVLGEQSAKALRGGEMSDVIFSGSDSLAAVGMAEVSMTFSECERELGLDFHEVKLTRRVYRDGKSEYLINGTACRLRDIQQLFMDTGIGRTAYSIMEQGRIDQLLSSRPEDRRAVFEEAAGITRYKSQKREALRKLEQTEQNLVRLDDILKEVQRQLNSLSRQAAKARRHQEFSTQLRLFETHLADVQYRQWKSEIDALDAKASELRAQGERTGAAIVEAEAQLADQQRELNARDEALTAARGFANEVKNRLGQSQSRLEFNRERINEGGGLIERLNSEISAAEEKQRQQSDRLNATDSQERELNDLLLAQQSRIDQEHATLQAVRLRRADAEASLQRATQSAVAGESKLQFLRAELARTEASTLAASSQHQHLVSELAALTPARATAVTGLEEVRASLAETARAAESRREAQHAAESELRMAQNALQEIEARHSRARHESAGLHSKLEVLRQLNLEGEGLAEGAKAVLHGLDRPEFFKPAVLGALASLIEVTEPQFIPAIEAALGENLQAVLLADPDVAANALETLRSKQLGRASVAPTVQISDLGLRISDFDASHIPVGATAHALSKVKVAASAMALVKRLLGDTWIAPDLDTARQIVAARPTVNVVTPAGEVISRDGIWRGGRTETAGGGSILQRKSQITELQAHTETARLEVSAVDTERESASARVAHATTSLNDLRNALQSAQVQASELTGRVALLEREEREVARREEALRREQEQIAQRAEDARERATTLGADIAASLASVTGTQDEIGAHRHQVDELCHQENERAEQLSQLRAQFAAEQRGRDEISRQRQELAARRDEWAAVLAERRAELDRFQARLDHYNAEIAGLDEAIRLASAELSDADKETERLALARLNVAGVIGELEGALRAHRRESAALHDQRGEIEVHATQVRLRQENLGEKITQRYAIDLALFIPEPESLQAALADRRGKNDPPSKGEPWAEVGQIVVQLQERLNSIGAVNVDAILEYDELAQRNNFLETQRNDLTKSRDELQGIIAKINATTLELFTSTFERVRGNFQEMFTELFGGGRANLILSDENDPLECGIEIVARPPGKQLQSITLLSGGERTMTAVALLFAIYMVKPSPFCVLDEMDAPLDESNIGRFIKVLDRFVQQSQFLVITHNKRTIARADVLYGVTMEQPGVSKPVAVRFTEHKDRVNDRGNGIAEPPREKSEHVQMAT